MKDSLNENLSLDKERLSADFIPKGINKKCPAFAGHLLHPLYRSIGC